MSTTTKSSPTRVLDAYAVLAFLQGEQAAEHVERLLEAAERGRTTLLISVINAAEVYYRFCKLGRTDEADSFLKDLKGKVFPVRVASATDARVYSAARLKGRHAISLADAFAAALAIEYAAPVVTGAPEFRALEEAGEVGVEWLGTSPP